MPEIKIEVQANTSSASTALDKLAGILERIQDATKSINSGSVNALSSRLSNLATAVNQVNSSDITSTASGIGSLATKLSRLSASLSGIDPSKLRDVLSAASEGVSSSGGSRSSRYSGSMMSEGVAEGIQSSAGSAVSAAKQMSQEVVDTVHDTMGIGSPSKWGIYDGEMLIQGIVVGIKTSIGDAVAAAAAAGKAVNEALKANTQDSNAFANWMSNKQAFTISPMIDSSKYKKEQRKDIKNALSYGYYDTDKYTPKLSENRDPKTISDAELDADLKAELKKEIENYKGLYELQAERDRLADENEKVGFDRRAALADAKAAATQAKENRELEKYQSSMTPRGQELSRAKERQQIERENKLLAKNGDQTVGSTTPQTIDDYYRAIQSASVVVNELQQKIRALFSGDKTEQGAADMQVYVTALEQAASAMNEYFKVYRSMLGSGSGGNQKQINAVMEMMGGALGGRKGTSAENARFIPGAVQKANAMLAEYKENIGQAVQPDKSALEYLTEMRAAANQITRLRQKISTLFDGDRTEEGAKEMEAYVAAVKDAQKAFNTAKSGFRAAVTGGNIGGMTAADVKSSKGTAKNLNTYVNGRGGKSPITGAVKNSQSQLEQYRSQIQTEQQKLQQMITQMASHPLQNITGAMKDVATPIQAASDKLSKFTEKVKQVQTDLIAPVTAIKNLFGQIGSAVSQVMAPFTAVLGVVGSVAKVIGGVLSSAFSVLKGVLSGIASAIGNVVSGFMSIASAIGQKLLSGIQAVITAMGKLSASLLAAPFTSFVSTVTSAVSSIMGTVKRFLNMMVTRLFRNAANSILSSAKTGIDNLYAWAKTSSRSYIKSYAKSLDSLANTFATLQNSIGAAAAPIINLLVPYINAAINAMITLVNLVAQFFTALGGSGTFVKAKKAVAGYGSAASGADDEVKDLLADFDELNVLNDDSSSGGSGSGSGSGSGFTTETIDGTIANIAKSVKDAIDNNEWIEAGRALSDGLNELLSGWNSKEWGEKLGNKLNKGIDFAFGFLNESNYGGLAVTLGKKLGGLVNGAVSTINWYELGGVLSEGFEFGVTTLISLLDTIEWDKVADAVHDFITGALRDFTNWIGAQDWGKLGKDTYRSLKQVIEHVRFSDIVQHAVELLKTFFSKASEYLGNINWGDLGTTITEELKKRFNGDVKWDELAQSFFGFLGTAFGGFTGFISGIFQPILDGINDFFSEKVQPKLDGGEGLGQAWMEALTEEGSPIATLYEWLKTNVIEPFTNAFSEAFSAAGGNNTALSQGLNQIKATLNSWWNWINLKIVQPFLNAFGENGGGIKGALAGLGAVASSVWEDIKPQIEPALTWLSEKLRKVGETIGSGIATGIAKALGLEYEVDTTDVDTSGANTRNPGEAPKEHATGSADTVGGGTLPIAYNKFGGIVSGDHTITAGTSLWEVLSNGGGGAIHNGETVNTGSVIISANNATLQNPEGVATTLDTGSGTDTPTEVEFDMSELSAVIQNGTASSNAELQSAFSQAISYLNTIAGKNMTVTVNMGSSVQSGKWVTQSGSKYSKVYG